MLLGATALLAACAQPKRVLTQSLNGEDFWSGRLGLQIAEGAEKSFSAAFELSGDADRGELVLFNPLGNVLAKLKWSPGMAQLESPDQNLESDSLSVLVTQIAGSDVPIQALFGWLKGIDVKVTGWDADLSRIDSGRLIATRNSPLPVAELRVVLNR